jgi:hypothetical protein
MSATVIEQATSSRVSLPFSECVLLVRLLTPAKKPPTLKKVKEDIGAVLATEPSSEQVQVWIDELRDAGFIQPAPGQARQKYSKLGLTETGRAEALAFLGISVLPSKFEWKTAKAKYFVARALGIDPNDKAMAERLKNEGDLAALLIKRQYHLPAETGTTLNSVLEALLCQTLGFQNETSLKGLKTAQLMKMLGAPMPLSQEQMKKQIPRVLLKTTKGGIAGLRELVLRESVQALCETHPADSAQPVDTTIPLAPSEPFDLTAFAHTVQAAARNCQTGWYYDNKVFINHVYQSIASEPAFSRMTIDDFKQRLVEANRANLLRLSSADLVTTMNPEDVKASETHQLNATYHFILVEKERP